MRRLFISILFFSSLSALAQKQPVTLSDVTSFKLVWHEGGLMNEYRILEVVPADTDWACYQTHLRGHTSKAEEINDSTRTFIKDIPSKILTQLLRIIARKDTGVNAGPFKISKTELITYTDSIKADLKLQQKAEFIDSLRSEAVINYGLNKALQPFMLDDRAYYGITITTRQNQSFTIKAYSFGYLFNLPWYIDNIKSYDPNISIIYEFISGHDKYAEYEQKRLYHDMDWEIYKNYFMTRFNWEDLKSDQPVSFALLKNTLTPTYFYRDSIHSSISFRSSLLPKYVNLPFAFRHGDTSAVAAFKRYEDTIANVFKRDNFLFDDLKMKPGYRMVFDHYKMSRGGKYIFKEIKKYFTGIDGFDYKKSQFIVIYKEHQIDSKWILLPNNSLIMVEDNINDTTGLLSGKVNFSDDLKRPHANPVVVIFDASGKIIYNYGLADINTHY